MTKTTEEIKERLRHVLLNGLSEPPSAKEIPSDVPITEEGLALDSVALFEFVVGIENEFNVILDDESLSIERFNSLDTLAEFIQTKLKKESSVPEKA